MPRIEEALEQDGFAIDRQTGRVAAIERGEAGNLGSLYFAPRCSWFWPMVIGNANPVRIWTMGRTLDLLEADAASTGLVRTMA